jgi:uncharacterized protein
MMMPDTSCTVPTAHGSRYLQQLCKHWSHKFEVQFDATAGRIALPFGVTELAADDEALAIGITLNEGADVLRAQQVVADHINRFAFREGALEFEWRDA